MVAWEERPIEVAHLFNPAYCSLLLRETAIAYEHTGQRGLEYALAFLVLPVVLHRKTRALLPGDTRTKLHVWMQRHHEARIGFAERMQNLVPVTKEALLFGLQHQALQVNEVGALVVGGRELGKLPVPKTAEAALCLKKAAFLGHWFAEAGKPATLLATWGVKVE
jgi:hypothetical protein